MREDWTEAKIGEVFEILDNQRRPLSEEQRKDRRGNYPYYGANGLLDWIDDFIFSEPLILIAEDGGHFDEFATRKIAYPIEGRTWVNNHAHVLRPNLTVLDFAYAVASLEHRDIRRFLNGGTRSKLNKGELEQIPIFLPPLGEQRQIGAMARAWDKALEKLFTLRALKERRLIGLRAALLFGELRLNGQRRNWAPTRLGAVTHELTRRNGAKGLGRDFVMGVTKADGVVPMREQTIAGDISRYKRLPPRAFAYNPMRINVGSIAMNEREDELLVSPDYVVFACNADGLDPDYLDHLRKTSWWAHYINSGGSGSVRQRTYYDDLAALKLPLPELDEQKAIAAVLNTARADLAATEREIEAITLQKRGLMQKLLTGEWRVPLDPAETSAATEETEHAG